MEEYKTYIRTDLPIEFSNVDEYPVIGIIIPCYNHGHYLQKTLTSIAKQDYPNKLIIIIDDKSTDDSLNKAKEFLLETKSLPSVNDNTVDVGKILLCTNANANELDGVLVPTVVIGLHENGKQANARNIGIAMTWNYCDYYCQLDADDEYLPDKLSKCMEVAKSDRENIGIVYHDVLINNTITGITTHEFREPYSWDRLAQECIICNTMLINKSALQEVGLYDKDISPTEDWDLQLRICEKFMAIHIAEPLSIYNVVESSCTFTVDKTRWQWCWNRIREKLQQRHAK